jgi:hypothetical protein
MDKGATVFDYAGRLTTLATESAQLASVSGEKKLGDSIVTVTPRNPASVADFPSGVCSGYIAQNEWVDTVSSCTLSFYLMQRVPSTRPAKTALDTLYLWNRSDARAYQKIRKDISLNQLLTAQNAYKQLWQKILLQKKEERTVAHDASSDAPLVSSLW